MTLISSPRSRCGNIAGVLLTIVLVCGLIGLGMWMIMRPKPVATVSARAVVTAPLGAGETSASGPTGAKKPDGNPPVAVEPEPGAPRLAAAATFVPKNNVVTIDISEYAGYAGLIVANGGLKANPDSFFAKRYGFQVELINGKDENWSDVNNGKLAGCATTTDVLAVMGRQFESVAPVQISYSRGSDMIVVDRGITSVNQLAGRIIAGEQFNESEFFVRFLAQ